MPKTPDETPQVPKLTWEHLQELLNDVNPKVAGVLGLEARDVPLLNETPSGGGEGAAAYADPRSGQIVIDPTTVQRMTETASNATERDDMVRGLLAHELTHVYMMSSKGAVGTDNLTGSQLSTQGDPGELGAIQEGLADYVRDKLGYAKTAAQEPENEIGSRDPLASLISKVEHTLRNGVISPSVATHGYQDTASVLTEAGATNENLIPQLVQRMLAGDPHPFETVTSGQSLKQQAQSSQDLVRSQEPQPISDSRFNELLADPKVKRFSDEEAPPSDSPFTQREQPLPQVNFAPKPKLPQVNFTGDDDQHLFGPTSRPLEHGAAGSFTPDRVVEPPPEVHAWHKTFSRLAEHPDSPPAIRGLRDALEAKIRGEG